MINALFSRSVITVPGNFPWTESVLSKDALFIILWSSILRKTITLNLSCSPLPFWDINSRARRRPIRPNPNKITSLGLTWMFVLSINFNFSIMKLLIFSYESFSFIHSKVNFPMSILDAVIFDSAIAFAIAKVSLMFIGFSTKALAYSCRLSISLDLLSINWFLKIVSSIDRSNDKSLVILISSIAAFSSIILAFNSSL